MHGNMNVKFIKNCLAFLWSARMKQGRGGTVREFLAALTKNAGYAVRPVVITGSV
jgi:hypothetical protein